MTSIATPPDSLVGNDLQHWVLQRALSSKEGREAVARGRCDISKAKRIVVVKRGTTVNIVL